MPDENLDVLRAADLQPHIAFGSDDEAGIVYETFVGVLNRRNDVV